MAHFEELKQETDQFDDSKTNLVVQRVVVVANDKVARFTVSGTLTIS